MGIPASKSGFTGRIEVDEPYVLVLPTYPERLGPHRSYIK